MLPYFVSLMLFCWTKGGGIFWIKKSYSRVPSLEPAQFTLSPPTPIRLVFYYFNAPITQMNYGVYALFKTKEFRWTFEFTAFDIQKYGRDLLSFFIKRGGKLLRLKNLPPLPIKHDYLLKLSFSNGVAITCLASSQKILIFWGEPGQVDWLLEGAQAA